MRFPEPMRMSDDQAGPVWARTKRRPRAGGGGVVGLLVTLLALFGVLTVVLGVKERSLAEGGALVDGWIAVGVDTARRLAGQAPEATAAAAARTDDAPDAGAVTATDRLKTS